MSRHRGLMGGLDVKLDAKGFAGCFVLGIAACAHSEHAKRLGLEREDR